GHVRVEAAAHAAVPRALRGAQHRVDRGAFLLGRRPTRQAKVHRYLEVTAGSAAGSLSIRTAVALNSAVPDFGSTASIVRTFVATSSAKCTVMNARPGRRPASKRTGTSTDPRRDDTPTSP